MIDNIKVLGNRVLVRANKRQEKTSTGIYLPPTAKIMEQSGVIVKTGTLKADLLNAKIGDTVYFKKQAGTVVPDGTDEYFILDQEDIIIYG